MTNNKPKIIIANWKMNPDSFTEADNIVKTVKKGIKKSKDVKVIICPPNIYLSKIKSNSYFDLGAQNIFWEDLGAYTGEISAKMVKNSGAKYAIIGHSERRLILKETDEMVNLKILSALRNGLKPILCIGETAKEKKQNKTGEVIIGQLEKNLMGVSRPQISNSNFLIAYEPVWAIGTGDIPSYDETMSARLLIKKIIARNYDMETAERVPILYGGSINSRNAYDSVEKAGVDGLLVGGASLNASEFVRIVNLFGIVN